MNKLYQDHGIWFSLHCDYVTFDVTIHRPNTEPVTLHSSLTGTTPYKFTTPDEAIAGATEYVMKNLNFESPAQMSINKWKETNGSNEKNQPQSDLDIENMLKHFLEYIEDNYYYNSGCWLDCDTDEPSENLIEIFLKQYESN